MYYIVYTSNKPWRICAPQTYTHKFGQIDDAACKYSRRTLFLASSKPRALPCDDASRLLDLNKSYYMLYMRGSIFERRNLFLRRSGEPNSGVVRPLCVEQWRGRDAATDD